MNHQPFEDWLLADGMLEDSEVLALQQHLRVCEACRNFEAALRAMEVELRASISVGPAPGFVRRWQFLLAQRRRREIARQSWTVLAFCGLSSIVLAALLAFQWATSFQSVTDLIAAPAYSLTSFFTLSGALRDVLLAFVGVTPPVWWLGLAGGLSLLVLFWALTMTRTGPQRLRTTFVDSRRNLSRR